MRYMYSAQSRTSLFNGEKNITIFFTCTILFVRYCYVSWDFEVLIYRTFKTTTCFRVQTCIWHPKVYFVKKQYCREFSLVLCMWYCLVSWDFEVSLIYPTFEAIICFVCVKKKNKTKRNETKNIVQSFLTSCTCDTFSPMRFCAYVYFTVPSDTCDHLLKMIEF